MLISKQALNQYRFDSTRKSVFFLMLGSLMISLFHVDVYFPIAISVVLMAYVVAYFVKEFKTARIGVLVIILLLVYLLPFIHIPPYLWFDFNSNPILLWGLAVNAYMLDEQIIKLTAMLGACGALGMAYGVSLMRGTIIRDTGSNSDGSKRNFKSFTILIWVPWVVIGVSLAWLTAPQETIFVSQYTMSKSLHADSNFSSLWMIPYIILSFTFADALIDRDKIRRAVKFKIAIIVIAFVVIWFQLLRGDRESIPWIFGLAVLYFYWGSNLIQRKKLIKIPWLKFGAWLIILIFVSMIIGAIRHSLTGSDLSNAVNFVSEMFSQGDLSLSNMLYGTWSATLLTPLSVAGDHVHDLLAMKWGQDYLNLLLSLPPGFIADAFGYSRPLDSLNGPAWEMRYGIGGTHAVVVPFMNFRMAGVFIIPAIYAYLLAKYERHALRRISVISLSFLVTIVLAAPHWLWYGEKSGINAIVIWAILAFFYRISLAFGAMLRSENASNKSFLING